MYVVDASVAIRWFLKEEAHPYADQILEHLLSNPDLFAVPELFFFETLAVLSRMHPDPMDAYIEGILPVFQSGPLRYPMTIGIAQQAVELTKRGLGGYDACYVALAIELKGTWLTFDSKAHRVIESIGISIDLNRELPEFI